MLRLVALALLLGCGGLPTADPDAGEFDAPEADLPDAPRDAPTLVMGRHDVLFVGNSYVFTSDVSGRYRSIVESFGGELRVEEVSTGGHRWVDHATDARTDGTRLAELLRTGAPDDHAFDAVILQEQSQTAGLPDGGAEREASVAAARELAELAMGRGAAVVLYSTWGRERGDDTNPDLFPTYLAMQDRIDANYLVLAEYLVQTLGATVRVAPVGGAFRLVYEDVLDGGGDPLAEGSEFDALYDPDGSHPSIQGAYLAACVLVGTVTAAEPRAFPDEPTLGADVSGRLRDACARALSDERWMLLPVRVESAALHLPELSDGTRFGSTLAVASDGSRLLVGTCGLGAARVLVDTPDGFAFEASLSVGWGCDSASRANDVALSADGVRAVGGAPGEQVDFVAYAGMTRAFERSGTTWSERRDLLRGVTTRGQAFGDAVAISADGTRVIVGAPGEAESEGRARIYEYRGGLFVEEALLAPADGTPVDGTLGIPGDAFGVFVALDATGTRAFVGAPAFSLGWGTVRSGAVHVFLRTDAGWVLEQSIPSPLGAGDRFGGAIAVSPDGGTLAIGAEGAERVVVLERASGAYVVSETLGPLHQLRGWGLDGGGPMFGSALAMADDGNTLLVGSGEEVRPGGLGAGSATLFRRVAGAYRPVEVILPSDPGRIHGFGRALAITGDGRRAFVGAPEWGNARWPVGGGMRQGFLWAGAVYVYDLEN